MQITIKATPSEALLYKIQAAQSASEIVLLTLQIPTVTQNSEEQKELEIAAGTRLNELSGYTTKARWN